MRKVILGIFFKIRLFRILFRGNMSKISNYGIKTKPFRLPEFFFYF